MLVGLFGGKKEQPKDPKLEKEEERKKKIERVAQRIKKNVEKKENVEYKTDEKKNDNDNEQAFWYYSEEYMNLFNEGYKKDPEHIFKLELVGINNNDCKYDDSHIDKWTPDISDPNFSKHPYNSLISDAINLWKRLRRIGHGDKDNLWKRMIPEDTSDDMKKYKYKGFYTYLDKDPIAATKGTMIIPYTFPLLFGILNNPYLMQEAFDEFQELEVMLEEIDRYTKVSYAEGKSASMFVDAREFLTLDFWYDLGNGEVIFGFRSIPNYPKEKIPKPKKEGTKFIRGTVELELYHFRPFYEKNINYTFVEYYSWSKMNGNIPAMMLNSMTTETPLILVNLKESIDEEKEYLGKPGELFIPLELLTYYGINHKRSDGKIGYSVDGILPISLNNNENKKKEKENKL